MDKDVPKHQKYIDFYTNHSKNDTEYWGLGIENETYLVSNEFVDVPKETYLTSRARERYSVNYWLNYKDKPLLDALSYLSDKILTPKYVNSHSFTRADIHGEHATLYRKVPVPNPKFTGTTVDAYLKEKSAVVRELFEKNMIYDGDTFEFTTFDFYKATVQSTVAELNRIKATYLREVNEHLPELGSLSYPTVNHGFAIHSTNPRNIATCNNSTYHINITLPTKLKDGSIANEKEFKNKHANAIRGIQWIEPLLVALYGTPDILSCFDAAYAAGSQRLALSRYIGLGTYETSRMEKGKLMDTTPSAYMKYLHEKSHYNPPSVTGYDFNYNKFTKHGIEFRALDAFPVQYLEPVMNFLVLICDYSTKHAIPDPIHEPAWTEATVEVLRKGSVAIIEPPYYRAIRTIFGMNTWASFCRDLCKCGELMLPLPLMQSISDSLWKKRGDVSAKLSPGMTPPQFVDYNGEVKKTFRKMMGMLT
jgi:hypothetical protein